MTLPPAALTRLPETPQNFKEAGNEQSLSAATSEAWHADAWWQVFDDPDLNALVERANRDNTTIALAAARLAQARALIRTADASRAAGIRLNAGASRQGGPLVNAAGTDGSLVSTTASFSYDLDLSGRLASASEAASLDAGARAAQLQGARLLVQAEIAQSYFALRALDAEQANLRDLITLDGELLRLTGRRFQSGLATASEVEQARTDLAMAENDALSVARQRAEREHALALLTGQAASAFGLDSAEWRTQLPGIPAGLPATMLQRRPDITAAQASMRAARVRLGAAGNAWFPDITLTASGGYASSDLANLFRLAMRTWSSGGLLALPLFDGGRREADVQHASTELDVATVTYREQVLTAFKEVEDHLSALRLLAAQANLQVQVIEASRHASAMIGSRYRNGLVSKVEPLLAQRESLHNHRQALLIRVAQHQSTVSLIRALGGGWDASTGAQPM